MRLIDLYAPEMMVPGTLFLFELIAQRMEEPDTNISATIPTWQQHLEFIASKPYRAWLLIEDDEDDLIGYVSATYRNEIGIVLSRKSRHQGNGKWAVKELMRTMQPLPPISSECRGTWLANVNPDNLHSRHMFEGLGGKLIQVTYELPSS